MLRASPINRCGLCVDVHTKEAAAAGETPVRINLVAAWRETTVVTEAEQAAVALTEEGTRLATHQGVSDETARRSPAIPSRSGSRREIAGTPRPLASAARQAAVPLEAPGPRARRSQPGRWHPQPGRH